MPHLEMSHTGTGSYSSPIVISDEEDEATVRRQLECISESEDDIMEIDPPSLSSPLVKERYSSQSAGTKGYQMMLRMGFRPGRGLGQELDGDVEPLPLVLKHRYDGCGVGWDTTFPFGLDGIASASDSHTIPSSRKRKHGTLIRDHWLSDSTHLGAPVKKIAVAAAHVKNEIDPMVPPSKAIPPKLEAASKRRKEIDGDKLRPENIPLKDTQPNTIKFNITAPPDIITRTASISLHSQDASHGSPIVSPHFTGGPLLLPPLIFPHSFTSEIKLSSNFDHSPSQSVTGDGHSAVANQVPANSQTGSEQGKYSSTASSNLRNNTSLTDPTSPSQAPIPKSQLPIGMSSDLDPLNVHGLFPLGSSVPTRDGTPHIPDPSRTLVMESLPRKFRNPRWIRDWCRTVSKAHPAAVHVDVDPKAGKALIEFTHADLARTAFSSPRLTGNEGKGGIRVWWFKTNIPEVEEGEIREDDSQQTSQLPKKPKAKKKDTAAKKSDLLAQRPLPNTSHSRVPSLPPYFPGLPTNTPMFSNLHTLPPPTSLLPFMPDPTQFVPPFGFYQGTSLPSNIYPVYPSEDLSTSTPHQTANMVQAPGPSDHKSILPSKLATDVILTSSKPSGAMQVEPSGDLQAAVVIPTEDDRTRESRSGGEVNENTSVAPIEPPSGLLSVPALISGSNHLLPVSDVFSAASPVSIVHSATPPHSTPPLPTIEIPSEPRAMKNLPKGPSYTKRSLMARQKELEQRIARSKMELNKQSKPEQLAATANGPDSGALATTHADDELDNETDREERLRRMVLQSKKNKTPDLIASTSTSRPGPPDDASVTNISKSAARQTEAALPISMANPDSAISSVTPSSVSSTPASTPGLSIFDDLAVSFITETLQGIKPLPLKPVPSTQKLQLAAKQKMLEQHIAESKALMQKLNVARTKEEKESILATMRERSRLMEEDMKPPSPTAAVYSHSTPQAGNAALRIRWPETKHDAGLLIVSDDEDDD